MKKICYVVTIPLTIKAFFIPQLKYLANNGFEVTVICSFDEKLQQLLGDNIRYIPVEIPRGISIQGSIIAIKKLKNIFKKEQFDLIQYSTPNAALYASIAAKIVKCKVRNYHLMGFRYLGANGIGKKILKAIEKITCKNSTCIECVSNSNLNIGVQDRIFPKEKSVVVWNGSTGGVDLNRFNFSERKNFRDEIRNMYQLGDNDFVYGFVGRITKDKGIDEILESFNRVEDAKLMIIGNDEGVNTLNQELYQKSLMDGRVIYTGNVDNVEKYFAAIDVLLFPSYREGFGNVVIEAAAMGTPAIISNIPGPIDAVNPDITALVVQDHDVEDLFAAMSKIRLRDYERMGLLAKEYVCTHFDSAVLCERICDRKNYLLQ